MEMFGRRNTGEDGDEATRQMSLYRRFLLNKQPQLTFKSFEKLNQNLESLKRIRN